MGEDSWDLIHLAMLCGSVTSWHEMYANVLRWVTVCGGAAGCWD